MKVFIAVDMEGIAGLFQWDNSEIDLQKRLMTEEVNATIRGVFAGGASEVHVGESHANMRSILPELLDPRAYFLSGQPKPMNHMAGVDSSFDLAIFIGYHSKAGTKHGVMAHTYGNHIFSLFVNDIEIGEIGMDAALCGFHGVPVGLIAGDKAACDEALEILPETLTASVKTGISRSSALSMPIEKARSLIEETSAKAVLNISNFKPYVFAGTVKVKVVFANPSYVDTIEHLDIITRVDGCTVEFEAENILKAFEWFNAFLFLSPAIR